MSPERQPITERRANQEPVNIEWQRLLEEALTLEGSMGSTYSRFYNYSFTNQLLLRMQGVEEPVATYKRWLEMGRQVQKGSKAKAILRPIAYKEINDKGEEERKVKGFKMVNCLFTASETEGDPLPEYEPPTWDKTRALGALAIQEVSFDQLNGNVQGFSYDRNVAINPVARYPFKTLAHEIGHVVLGHTEEGKREEYLAHRGLAEFEAESSAYLVLNELDARDQMNASESRSYISGWLQGEKPSDESIKRVFSTVDKVTKAGREKE